MVRIRGKFTKRLVCDELGPKKTITIPLWQFLGVNLDDRVVRVVCANYDGALDLILFSEDGRAVDN